MKLVLIFKWINSLLLICLLHCLGCAKATSAPPGIAASQWDCDFETNCTCNYLQSNDDDFDWTRHKGSTGSVQTGPSKDHTCGTDQGYYIYIETSPRGEGDIARLETSNVTNTNNKICVDFWYHMYGIDIGNLTVYSKVAGHLSTLWRCVGPRDDKWYRGQFQYHPTADFQISYEGSARAGVGGDIALDDLRIYYGDCDVIQITIYNGSSSTESPVCQTPTYRREMCTSTDINECDSMPCLNGGECLEMTNGYICRCAAGFTGLTCETTLIDASFNAALDKVLAFVPDRNLSNAKQIEILEDLGQSVLNDISNTIYQPNETETIHSHQLEGQDLAYYINRTAEIISHIAEHVPEEGELRLETDGIAVTAKALLEHSDDNILVDVHKGCKIKHQGPICELPKVPPSVTMKMSGRRNEDKTIVTITYMESWDDGSATEADFVDVMNQTEVDDANTTMLLGSGMIAVDMTVNGSRSYEDMDIEIPIQRPNRTLITTDKTRQVMEALCASWDEKTKTFSTAGCLSTNENGDTVKSRISPSKGITSFAILLQVREENIRYVDQEILSLLTNIFSTLSLIALGSTIVILMAFESLRKSERNIIHINLSGALFAAQLLFLVAVDKTHNELVCIIIAMLLHYLFLSVFGWMLVEGLNLYYKIVKVYGAEKNRMPMYIGIGWGLPVPIVVISAGIRFYSYSAANSCWLNTANGIIWAFAGPVVFVFLVNTVLLCVIARILFLSTTAVKDNRKLPGISTSIRGALILTLLLGTPWIVGLFATGQAAVTFQYVFVILNSLQGVFIHVIYCLLNQEVRSVIMKSFRRRKLNSIAPMDMSQTGVTSTKTTTEMPKPTEQADRVYDDKEMARRREIATMFWTKLIDEIDN